MERPDDNPHLPSWNDGPTRDAIVAFVESVTTPSSPHYVAPEERTAAFAHDGVLWCAHPLPAEVLFARDRLEALAIVAPSLWDRSPFTAMLGRDPLPLRRLDRHRLHEAATAIHAGETVKAYTAAATAWLHTAAHPELILPFASLTYRPQAELIGYLKAHGFRCYIVSAGDAAFIRAIAAGLHDIPPEQVIGSLVALALNPDGALVRGATSSRFNHGAAKVESIEAHIGRRPLLAFGGSDSDLPMLRYVREGQRNGLALMLHHDDGAREIAYDREHRLAPLVDGLLHADALGFTVVSMKRDWRMVFA